ncbi:hypothetical protein MNG54_RS25265 [Escherichia coli]|nr:hypothetical protein [Escherichia coli]
MNSLFELIYEHIRLYGAMNYNAIRKLVLQYFQTCPPADDQIKACLYCMEKNGLVYHRGFRWYSLNDDDE